MNIFVTNPCPHKSARVLPDKHIVKMPLETCQMLAVVYSKWYFNWGDELLHKKDGSPYNTKKGAFRGHPCTVWAAQDFKNTAWLIAHGVSLCLEYYQRYNKIHSCSKTINEAKEVFFKYSNQKDLTGSREVKTFAFAGPDEFKFDTSIDTFTAYKRYISSKPWVASNYLRDPSRKPNWL